MMTKKGSEKGSGHGSGEMLNILCHGPLAAKAALQKQRPASTSASPDEPGNGLVVVGGSGVEAGVPYRVTVAYPRMRESQLFDTRTSRCAVTRETRTWWWYSKGRRREELGVDLRCTSPREDRERHRYRLRSSGYGTARRERSMLRIAGNPGIGLDSFIVRHGPCAGITEQNQQQALGHSVIWSFGRSSCLACFAHSIAFRTTSNRA
ncbi:hypothetical protein F4780DRAFT_120324 [Xylariomycetidae sp. FL0641]|nr:hypothetical protein F4780DRAFT_120324 [Xylariomycetidae sp. FL0641]